MDEVGFRDSATSFLSWSLPGNCYSRGHLLKLDKSSHLPLCTRFSKDPDPAGAVQSRVAPPAHHKVACDRAGCQSAVLPKGKLSPRSSRVKLGRRWRAARGQLFPTTLPGRPPTPALLPARLGDDHLGAQLVEFIPEFFGLQATGDFGHLLAGDDGRGGNERLRAKRRGGRAGATISTKLGVSIQAGQLTQRLGAGGLLHKLFWGQGKGRMTASPVPANRLGRSTASPKQASGSVSAMGGPHTAVGLDPMLCKGTGVVGLVPAQ